MHVSHAAIASTTHSKIMLSEERKRVLCIAWSITEQARLLGLAIFRIFIRLFPRMARSKLKNVAHSKHPVRRQRSDSGISMDTFALLVVSATFTYEICSVTVRESLANTILSIEIPNVYGGISDSLMLRALYASERAAPEHQDLVGKTKRVCWCQRLQRIENSSVPVREQPLSTNISLESTVSIPSSCKFSRSAPRLWTSKSKPITLTNHHTTENECILASNSRSYSSDPCLSYRSNRVSIRSRLVGAPTKKSPNKQLSIFKSTNAKG
jgi:hypothetical protein